jgi:hypothetical protein
MTQRNLIQPIEMHSHSAGICSADAAIGPCLRYDAISPPKRFPRAQRLAALEQIAVICLPCQAAAKAPSQLSLVGGHRGSNQAVPVLGALLAPVVDRVGAAAPGRQKKGVSLPLAPGSSASAYLWST